MSVLFIDGVPGSGKSSLATALGTRIPGSRVFLEMAPLNPLHVVPARGMGASFDGIDAYSPEELAAKSLDRWRDYASGMQPGPDIFESYPYQSGARLLLQIDAPRDLIFEYCDNVEETIAGLDPRLIYLTSHNVLDDIDRISKLRGREWTQFVEGFVAATPWAANRGLKPSEAAYRFIEEFDGITKELLSRSRMRRLELPGGPDYGPETVERAAAWLG